MRRLAWISVVGTLSLAACSSSGTPSTSGGTSTGGINGPTLTLGPNMTFSPSTLNVAPGATITVINTDNTTHTATSEAMAGAYTEGQTAAGFLFDTGDVAAGATATISVPANVASGTSQPFFCKIHKNMMVPSDPIIQVIAPTP